MARTPFAPMNLYFCKNKNTIKNNIQGLHVLLIFDKTMRAFSLYTTLENVLDKINSAD